MDKENANQQLPKGKNSEDIKRKAHWNQTATFSYNRQIRTESQSVMPVKNAIIGAEST